MQVWIDSFNGVLQDELIEPKAMRTLSSQSRKTKVWLEVIGFLLSKDWTIGLTDASRVP